MEFPTRYDYKTIDQEWGKYWANSPVYQPTKEELEAADPETVSTIVIPPPNVTGYLHMGHGLNNTYQDLYNRWSRAHGKLVCWVPGTDHAGIATQNVVEKNLLKDGISRKDLGRDEFINRVWEWKKEKGGRIIDQLHRLGASCDWSRERFTMDPFFTNLVQDTFLQLHEEGLIYKAKYPINWCRRCQTALSNEEIEHHDAESTMYYIRYPIRSMETQEETGEYITVATSRPETIFADIGLAVNPKDEKNGHLVREYVTIPLTDSGFTVVGSPNVDPEFGTGVVKITPAHDRNDYELCQQYTLRETEGWTHLKDPSFYWSVIDKDGKMCNVPNKYHLNGVDFLEARERVVKLLDKNGLLEKSVKINTSLGYCYRCNSQADTHYSDQWFVRMGPLIDELKPHLDGLEIHPPHQRKILDHWLANPRDWCISRQIWWGHRIPVWKHTETGEERVQKDRPEDDDEHGHEDNGWVQCPDVLDTWFSSWLWAFGCWQIKEESVCFPTEFLTTGSDILFFWVIRMMIASVHFHNRLPFKKLYLHGIVRDKFGRKMSKSAGNGIDPVEIIDQYGADALRMTLMLQTPYGADVRIANSSFDLGRSFCTKLWNCTRYCLLNIPERTVIPSDADQLMSSELDLLDRWILTGLVETTRQVDRLISTARFSKAAELLHNFVWKNFCNGYLEIIKFKIAEPKTHQLLLLVLDWLIRSLFPFVPFICSELSIRLMDRLDLGEEYETREQILTRLATISPDPGMVPDWTRSDEWITSESVMNMWSMVGRIRNHKHSFKIPNHSGNFIIHDPEMEPYSEMIRTITRTGSVSILPSGTRLAPEEYIITEHISILRKEADVTQELDRLIQRKRVVVAEQEELTQFIDDDSLEGSTKSIKKEKRKAFRKRKKLQDELDKIQLVIDMLMVGRMDNKKEDHEHEQITTIE